MIAKQAAEIATLETLENVVADGKAQYTPLKKARARGRRGGKNSKRRKTGTTSGAVKKKRTGTDADMAEAEEGVDTRIETVTSGAAKTEPIRAGEIKKGMTVMLKGFPCKVIEVTTSKTGKHGHAKANITGIDIFTGKKYMDISPTSHNMTKPVVTTALYGLIDISEDGELTLMDDGGSTKQDMNLPKDDDLREKIMEAFARVAEGIDVAVTVTTAMDKEQITDVKVGTAN